MTVRLSALVVALACTAAWGLVSFLVGNVLILRGLFRLAVDPDLGTAISALVFLSGFIIALRREYSPLGSPTEEYLVSTETSYTATSRDGQAGLTVFVWASYLPSIAIGAFRTVIGGDDETEC